MGEREECPQTGQVGLKERSPFQNFLFPCADAADKIEFNCTDEALFWLRATLTAFIVHPIISWTLYRMA